MIINKSNYNIAHFIDSQLVTPSAVKNGTHRYNHLKFAMEQVSITGEVLEFGVYSGASINMIAEKFLEDIVHGFDSFEGLPEAWAMTKKDITRGNPRVAKGHFSVGQLPSVHSNVRLWKGWFNSTLPLHIKEIAPAQIKFLHVDCDLYSSTKTIFDLLNNHIVKETVIVFDEFYPFRDKTEYELWERHEYKALKEWVERYDREFTILGRSNYQQCSIKILK
jgi:hypothetical protein